MATHDDANDSEKGYFWYFVENVDTKTLSKERHILLSTWAAGTGHCTTLYVLKRVGSQFQKIWESTENLCTESILGAATSQATRDGRIIVRFREHSEKFDPDKEDAPQVLKVEITYKWDGSSYVNDGRSELPEPMPLDGESKRTSCRRESFSKVLISRVVSMGQRNTRLEPALH